MAARIPIKLEVRQTTPAQYSAANVVAPAGVTVGAAAAQVKAARTDRMLVTVQADPGNSGIVYVGISNAVTSANALAALEAGQSYAYGGYLGDVWAIGSAAGQDIHTTEVVRV